jgi:hypothetical protein
MLFNSITRVRIDLLPLGVFGFPYYLYGKNFKKKSKRAGSEIIWHETTSYGSLTRLF